MGQLGQGLGSLRTKAPSLSLGATAFLTTIGGGDSTTPLPITASDTPVLHTTTSRTPDVLAIDAPVLHATATLSIEGALGTGRNRGR